MGKEKEFGRDLEVAVTSWMEEIDSVKSRTSFQLKFLGMVGGEDGQKTEVSAFGYL